MQAQTIEDERIDTLMEVVRLRNEGKRTEASALIKKYPLEPEMAQIFKDVYGAEFLIKGGYNLSEVEATLGKDWIHQ
jgi:hypothetical protein